MTDRVRRAILLASLLLSATASADRIHLRDGHSALEGSGLEVSASGASMTLSTQQKVLISWDRVVRVEGGGATPLLAEHLERGERLWRARTRIERDDTDAAEAILAPLTSSATHVDDLSLLIWEGLLRCRLARGDQAGAVVPALQAARLRRRLPQSEIFRSLPPVIDAGAKDTWLCTQLPPVWLNGEDLSRLIADLESAKLPDEPELDAVRQEYWRAAMIAMGRESELAMPNRARDVAEHPAVRLMTQLVDCTVSDAAARSTARSRLLSRLHDLDPWSHAWARFMIGRSFLREPGAVSAQRGILHLLHVPARFGAQQPWLTGLALAHASDAARASGDEATAELLQHQMVTITPNHPALLRRPATAPATAATSSSASAPPSTAP